jgi:hypothetical protein
LHLSSLFICSLIPMSLNALYEVMISHLYLQLSPDFSVLASLLTMSTGISDITMSKTKLLVFQNSLRSLHFGQYLNFT